MFRAYYANFRQSSTCRLFAKKAQHQCQLCGRNIKHWPQSRLLQPIRNVSYALSELHATTSLGNINGLPPSSAVSTNPDETLNLKFSALSDVEKRRLFYKCAGCRTLKTLYYILELNSPGSPAAAKPLQALRSLAQLYVAFQGRSTVPTLSHPLMLELEQALTDNVDQFTDFQSLLEVLQFVQGHTTDVKIQKNLLLVLLNVLEENLKNYSTSVVIAVVKKLKEVTDDSDQIRDVCKAALKLFDERRTKEKESASTGDKIELFRIGNELGIEVSLSKLLYKPPSLYTNSEMLALTHLTSQLTLNDDDARLFTQSVTKHLLKENCVPTLLLNALTSVALDLNEKFTDLPMQSMLSLMSKHWEWCWYLTNLSRDDRHLVLRLCVLPSVRRLPQTVVVDQVLDFTQHAHAYSDAEMTQLLKVLAYFDLKEHMTNTDFAHALQTEVDRRYHSMDVDLLLTCFESLCFLHVLLFRTSRKYIDQFFMSRVFSK